MKIFNSLSRKIEEVEPLEKNKVGVYLCGPTVYDNAHIGHMRKYVGDDVMVRALRHLGYAVEVVMNITDVGHLVSDEDEGEDKMEKGARKYGLDVWAVAKKFEDQFFTSTDSLNIQRPNVVCRATEHIPEQIDLIKRIEKKGFAYRISDGIYFDTKAYTAAGNEYGQLSSMQEIEAGARIGVNDEKKDAHDFALWKFSAKGEKRQMEWDSPWGVGFPGWHIECSAMSMKYLGEQFDVHTGGIDHKEVHHPNEIAQAEAATGKRPFVKYWVHHNFLRVEGEKMSKSLGNLFTVQDVIDRGIDPLALRYLFLQTHYRKPMNFSWESLMGAEKGLKRLQRMIHSKFETRNPKQKSEEKSEETEKYLTKFKQFVKNDLAMPEVVALVWEVLRDPGLQDNEKLSLVLEMDSVLGLGLEECAEVGIQNSGIPKEVSEMVRKREDLRSQKKYDEADAVRKQIEERGYVVEDVGGESVVRKK